MFACPGADPHKENFEPLYFREKDCSSSDREDEEEEDEGYVPGTTPVNMAATPQVGLCFPYTLHFRAHIPQLFSHVFIHRTLEVTSGFFVSMCR